MPGKIVRHRTCPCTHKAHGSRACGSKLADGESYCEWCRRFHRCTVGK